MFGVLLLTKSSAFNLPAWALLFGVMLAAVFGAIAQWLVSARSRRQLASRVLRVAVVLAAVVMIWDCGWLYDWLCFAMI